MVEAVAAMVAMEETTQAITEAETVIPARLLLILLPELVIVLRTSRAQPDVSTAQSRQRA
jgi:hypothetical protein